MYARRNLGPMTHLLSTKGFKTPVTATFALNYTCRFSMVKIAEINSYFYFSGPASFVNGGCANHANAHVLYDLENPVIHTGDSRVNSGSEILILYNDEPIVVDDFPALCPALGCKVRIFTIQ